MDTGKYRNLVLTGEIYRPSRGRGYLELMVEFSSNNHLKKLSVVQSDRPKHVYLNPRIYVLGLEITYLLMYFCLDILVPTKFLNQTVQRNPTDGSRTLQNIEESTKTDVVCVLIPTKPRVKSWERESECGRVGNL